MESLSKGYSRNQLCIKKIIKDSLLLSGPAFNLTIPRLDNGTIYTAVGSLYSKFG